MKNIYFEFDPKHWAIGVYVVDLVDILNGGSRKVLRIALLCNIFNIVLSVTPQVEE